MLNPLLHTSNSAPTSPTVTRSIHAKDQNNNNSSSAKKILRQTLLLSSTPKVKTISGSGARRLSRVVKCRTIDFTEFPEGMREYPAAAAASNAASTAASAEAKMVLRESRSQPGSPVSIPKIRVQDFGGFAGSEVKNKRTTKAATGRMYPC